MSDNDIIKALKCCKGEDIPCADCPYIDFGQCQTYVASDALDLINRQKAEIEALKLINSTYETETKRVRDIAIKEFAVSLRNKFFNYYDGLTENTSKSNHNGDSLMFYEVADMIVDCIDNLVEEMTEDDDA